MILNIWVFFGGGLSDFYGTCICMQPHANTMQIPCKLMQIPCKYHASPCKRHANIMQVRHAEPSFAAGVLRRFTTTT